jgi:hypothetical protein
MGSKCDQCKQNHYGLDDSNEGCKPCECSIEGSISQQCNNITGECLCRPHAKGRKCDEIEQGFYCPGLDHLKFDAVNAINFNLEANLLEKSILYNYPRYSSNNYPGRKVLAKSNGEVAMIIEKTEISGFFNILVRYDVDGDWKVKIKIISKSDKYSLAGGTCDKYSFELSMNLQSG